MDLPPPPPLFRHQHQHQHQHHLRYGNVLHPPDLFPPPYTQHLPPPPPPPSQPRLPHIHIPPPSPPPRHIGHPPGPPSFTFFPPQRPILDRSHPCEVDLPPKPYFHRNHLPPPPPSRYKIPSRLIHDYPERNPILEYEIFRPGLSDNYIHELAESRDRNLHCGVREFHTRVPDTGDHERYRDNFCQSRELYNNRDDEERIWVNKIDDRGRDLYNERDYGERRLDSGMNVRGSELYNKRDYDGTRRDSGMNDRVHELYNKMDYEERRWDIGINDGGCELYHEGGDDNKRCDYSSNDAVLLQLENRQPELVENASSLGRFSGRLGSGVSKGEFGRSKKNRRSQKKNALHRIQLRQDCSRCCGGYKCQHSQDDKREREGSLELDISFKSNALVAKAILAPSRPAVKMGINSMNVNTRISSSMPDLPTAKSSKDVVKTDLMTHGLDVRSDSVAISKELLDKAVVPGSGSVTANDANDFGEFAVKNQPQSDMNVQGTGIIGSDRTRLRRKKRRARMQFFSNLDMNKGNGHIINVTDFINSPSAFPQLSSNTALSKGNISSAFIGVIPHTDMLPTSGGIVSEKGDNNADSYKPFLPILKRKRNSLTTVSASSTVADSVIAECSGHAERLVTTSEDADHVFHLKTDEVNRYPDESFLANESTGHGDSLGFNQHSNNVAGLAHNRVSILDTEKSKNESIDRHTRLGTDRVSNEVADSSRPQNPEVQKDKCFSEIHESNASSESDSASPLKPETVIISDLGSTDAILKEVFTDLVKIPQVVVDAEEFRSLEGTAVSDCSNITLGISTSSDFLSADHKRIIFDVSFPDALGKKSFIDDDDIGSAEGPLEATCNVETSSSVDYSSKIRKRKARGAQTGFFGSETNAVRSLIGEVGFAKDLVPAVEVDFLGEKDSYKEDDKSNEGSFGDEGSTLMFDFGNGPFPSYRKKRKVASPRPNLASLLDDDMVADELTSDCPELYHGFTRLAEREAESRECIPTASAAINERGTAEMEGTVGSDNYYVADLDENLADGNKLHTNGDLAFIANNLSLCSDGNGVCAASSGNELLASVSDIQSCTSSPEELLSNSGSSLLRNTKASACQPKNEMICGRDDISNRKPVSIDPKSLEKVASDNSQTNAERPPSSPEANGEVVKKPNIVHGKQTLSKNQLASAGRKVFPGHHPLYFSNSRNLHSTHATKSRTWHRTGNSPVAVTEVKLQPSHIPQSHGTKTSRNVQSSYIRKDNLKNNKASDNKTGDANAPSIVRTEKVNISETTKALPLNHCGKSLNCHACNLEEPSPVGNAPRNGPPCKTVDASEKRIKSSEVPECRADSGNSSNSQRTLEEGNSEKKIMYVKRRSNQLVAASNSGDTSTLGVDKSQASSSDGYYKSKKNQLVRASSENHVQKRDANGNSLRLVTCTILPRTCTRRQSGFAKSYKKSKLSSVWKLHDMQSSEKHTTSVGPQKFLPHLLPWKRTTNWRSFMHALSAKPNKSSFSTASQTLLLSRKRGAIYTRSTHGYSLRMSKVLSVGGSSLKWSKSIDRNSKKANEEATRAVAAAGKRKKEENGAVPIASKIRNNVSRKSVLSVKLRPADQEPSSSVAVQSETNVKRSYVPRRLLIGNEEYVRIGNGNKLVRDPKKRTRILASEKVRWSLRTARLRLARKRKYCQFFTRFGKCNKDDGKCPYIHDPSKVAVCTKFLNGSCTNIDCKLTHKVIPERMEDCSYFLKGSCSNDNCPYRHVNVKPDSAVCKSFLRGYCADGNECRKKHTYVCPAFEETGFCPKASKCKLHHPKKKIEKKSPNEEKMVRGRYFDGGLPGIADSSMDTSEKVSTKGKDDVVGKFPDYISLDVSDEEELCDEILPDAEMDDFIVLV
ncbi:hypothetical protein DH2020_034010 [Rehmannia glutinosa]|uniref:C3H1-type domain-containing protein n=1 Tax=Rehmannia glutinosa TaxID=99300 RepID=A0ABR0VEK4_REHGL